MNPSPKQFVFSSQLKILSALLIFFGIATFTMGLSQSPERAWANYLLNYFFWFSLGMGGIFFAALQYITGSVWSTPVRRVAEVFSGFLPIALLLFVVLLLFGFHTLYEWTHHAVVEEDVLLSGKSPYLNVSFFVTRQGLLYLLCFVGGGLMIRNSLKQDQSGGPKWTKKNVTISAPFILLFAFLFTFASFDLLMSLSPHWFSTIFGVYCWTGLFYSTLAMLTAWVILLRKSGHLTTYVNENHLQDLGKLMFAFLVFWGYIGFSQFMLIWYANLPEENFYYIVRNAGGWKQISIALILVKFVIPFFLIVSRFAKRNENWLLFVAIWFLGAHWLDLYWIVFPTFFKSPLFGWMELGIFGGFAGLFLFSVGIFLSRVPVLAIHDPYLQEGLHHHQ